jgi:hypothetical protein
MYEHHLRDENDEVPMTVDRVGPEWAERATMARQQEWSSDRELDPGDTHDKGEDSLCVGEAA